MARRQLHPVVDDLVEHDALDLDGADERLWVPRSEGVEFRPLILSVSEGYFVGILRVRRTGTVSRHWHTGPVQAFTLRGRWYYPEHGWWAEEGTYSFEPAGDVHTLLVPDDVPEMAALVHVTGACVHVDENGQPVAVEDVSTKLASARAHYARARLGAEYADRMIR